MGALEKELMFTLFETISTLSYLVQTPATLPYHPSPSPPPPPTSHQPKASAGSRGQESGAEAGHCGCESMQLRCRAVVFQAACRREGEGKSSDYDVERLEGSTAVVCPWRC